MLNSTITLAMTTTKSSITYAITVYNSTNSDYYFKDTIYSDEFYDNKDITFELNGLKQGDILKNKNKLTFYIKFKYIDTLTDLSNNVLNSYLYFKFVPAANLLATNYNSYNNALWKYRDSIAKIIIQNNITEMDNAITDDVSNEQDGTVISHVVSNEDGTTYTAYLQSDSIINLPTNSSGLFYNFMKLESIENINYLFKYKNVTNMNSIFMNDVKLQTLDISSFDTNNVTHMNYMFGALSSVTSLDLSNFNTSKVTTMANMFNGCKVIKTLDLSSFDLTNVTSVLGMFSATYNLRYAYARSEEDAAKLDDSSTGKALTCEFTVKNTN